MARPGGSDFPMTWESHGKVEKKNVGGKLVNHEHIENSEENCKLEADPPKYIG